MRKTGILLLLLTCSLFAQTPTDSKLVYADFENCSPDKQESNRGGAIYPASWQEKDTALMRSTATALFLDSDDKKRMALNFKLEGHQKYAGAALIINGLPQTNGKPTPEDLSGYKELSFEAEISGPEQIKVIMISEKTGLNVAQGFEPMAVVRAKPGFQTYKIPIKKFDVPSGSPMNNASAKDILKKITAMQFVVFELGSAGHFQIDNIELTK